ncbi:hypothetical protein [Alkalihalobacillus sp. BA299]|uniref:hypothetical protein n=1 Tax=Alkalihalobacillus sp. BA299 TaxID=2815938 RepID=UPI001ADA5F14|nr:hypothetical protein [Alkalihalobacillus sp. BA299]
MARKLSSSSVISILIAALFIIISIFLPWWKMTFYAPQYQEGLNISVYPYKLVGDIQIINSLNHYIGMANFSEETFPELQFLPFLIGALALVTIICALLRNKRFLYSLIGVFMTGGIYGLYYLHQTLTTFGTELDPKAPIEIDPFVPPIMGENTLANFVTNSSFSFGSFVIGLAFLLMLYPIWKERR